MQNFHRDGVCPVRDVLCRLGDKWTTLVLVTLHANGIMRFSDIQRTIGDISQRMLTVTLRSLETDGILERKGLCSGTSQGRIPPDRTRPQPDAAHRGTGRMGAGEQRRHSE